MAKGNLNLNKLREEIDRRKSESGDGEQPSVPPKDRFLSGLKESLMTGRSNESINKIKKVTNKATDYYNTTYNKQERKPFDESQLRSEDYQTQPPRKGKTVMTEDYDSDRENQLHQQFSQSNKDTLADALEGQMRKKNPQYQNQEPQQQPRQRIDEQYLTEKINDGVSQFLVENINEIFTESMKSILLEQFSKEKLREVIFEDKQIFKEMVVDVIRELQKKKKSGK